ncbi:hypothetical protein K6Q96_23855 [Grimontia kaedaensis]|uniref:Uncharacterized protein n=1 Tax=Grimontia kaedaensis TaxID=2872157 RepID=A0ABY4X0H2_9GAMM|nr:hypothetical protein [Grimontia kaedaensis]USH04748.1 hypothetical protein K6Q96_23855 [Grimontia kaedaensis]
MALEALAEAVLPIIGRAVGYIFVDILLNVICYLTGYVVLGAGGVSGVRIAAITRRKPMKRWLK